MYSSLRNCCEISLVGASMERLRRCRRAVDSGGLTGFVPMCTIIQSLIETRFPFVGPHETINVEEDLDALLTNRRLPDHEPTSQRLSEFADVARRAGELGYEQSSLPVKYRRESAAGRNAFLAAQHVTCRRLAPDIFYFTSPFVVPDPAYSKRKAFLFDQLWLSRDEIRPGRVRLLGLRIDRGHNAELERQQDEALGKLGYEVFRVSPYWCLVDAQRVIHEFLDGAGSPVFDRFRRNHPGNSIRSYQCAYCRGPMIRTPDGYGIVEDHDYFVHETCFNSAVDEGFFDAAI